jgi:tRNA(fMet)-specific endonuclease VapC
MYLLDTNHCSYIIDNRPSVMAQFQAHSESHFAISVITCGELLYMTEKSTRKAENLVAVRHFLDRIGLYLIDEETAAIYSQLKTTIFNQFAPKNPAKRRKASIQNLGFDDNDLWIAATALQHDGILVSADRDFTRMQQVCPLKLECWA